MGTRYSSTVTSDLSSYNADPPPDDGSQTEANKTKWSTVKNKLGDPTKGALENFDTSIVEHFDEGPDVKSTAYTTAASDYNTVLEVTGSTPISLADPTSVGAGYRTTVLNADTGTVTVDVDGGATVDGASSITLAPGESGTFMVNSGGTLYRSQGGQSPAIGPLPSGTKWLCAQASAPVGSTIDTSFDGRMVIVKGTINDGAVDGGATGGTDNPDLMDKVPEHLHAAGTLGGSTSADSAGSTSIPYGSQGSLVRAQSGLVWDDSASTLLWRNNVATSGSNSDVVNGLGNHSHSSLTVTGSTANNASAANWEPKYMTVIVVTKD